MRSPFHSEQRARIRQIRALKERLFAAVAANRPPELIDIVRASTFCGLVEAGVEVVEGTALNGLFLQLNTLLPAADALYDRFNPPPSATAVDAGTIDIDPPAAPAADGTIDIDQEGTSAFTTKETTSWKI